MKFRTWRRFGHRDFGQLRQLFARLDRLYVHVEIRLGLSDQRSNFFAFVLPFSDVLLDHLQLSGQISLKNHVLSLTIKSKKTSFAFLLRGS